MATALVNDNGIVENVVMASVDDMIATFGGNWVICPDWIGIGMNINTPDPSSIITEVSMRQARLALFQKGLLGLVQDSINNLNEPNKTTTQISWDYATVVRRDDDLVQALAPQLGLDEAGLDDLFTLASTL